MKIPMKSVKSVCRKIMQNKSEDDRRHFHENENSENRNRNKMETNNLGKENKLHCFW